MVRREQKYGKGCAVSHTLLGSWYTIRCCWGPRRQGGGKNMLPKPTEKTRGPSTSAASRPPGFWGGPQCSRERGFSSGAHFWGFQPVFMAFMGGLSWVLVIYGWFQVSCGHFQVISGKFWTLLDYFRWFLAIRGDFRLVMVISGWFQVSFGPFYSGFLWWRWSASWLFRQTVHLVATGVETFRQVTRFGFNYSLCNLLVLSRKNTKTFFYKIIFFFSGGWPDEVVARFLVGDADSWSYPPSDAQQPAGRDATSKRSEVRVALPRAPWGSLHGREVPRGDGKSETAQFRHSRLRMSEVHSAVECR